MDQCGVDFLRFDRSLDFQTEPSSCLFERKMILFIPDLYLPRFLFQRETNLIALSGFTLCIRLFSFDFFFESAASYIRSGVDI